MDLSENQILFSWKPSNSPEFLTNMLIGNGLIASAFKSFEADPSVVIFASGVSDSTCSDEAEYHREIILLNATIERYPQTTFVYFSTTGVKDPDLQATRYVQHKKSIEHRISELCHSYVILRTSNVVGAGGNRRNILNYFIEKIRNQEPFEVWSGSYRNFIGISEVFTLVSVLLKDKRFLNRIVDIIAPESFRVMDLVNYLGTLMKTAPAFRIIERGASPIYDHEICNILIKDYNLNIGPDYQKDLIRRFVAEAS